LRGKQEKQACMLCSNQSVAQRTPLLHLRRQAMENANRSTIPDSIRIIMLTPVPLGTAEGIQALLKAFEHDTAFTPTHWGPDERARNPYARDEVITHVTQQASFVAMPGLHRRTNPRYEAYFSVRRNGINEVVVEFKRGLTAKHLPAIFALGDALAGQLRPEFGMVHSVWQLGETSQQYSAVGVLTAQEFQRYGPDGLGARTWLGAHLAALIGRERLNSCSAPVQDTDWGGVRIDLVDQPWTADFPSLHAQQQHLQQCLAPSGAFGDYTQSFKYQPGPQWTPVPVE
jgi:hypothetical protein